MPGLRGPERREEGARPNNRPGPFKNNKREELVVSLRADVALALEVEDDLVRRFFGGELLGLDDQLGVARPAP